MGMVLMMRVVVVVQQCPNPLKIKPHVVCKILSYLASVWPSLSLSLLPDLSSAFQPQWTQVGGRISADISLSGTAPTHTSGQPASSLSIGETEKAPPLGDGDVYKTHY
jgi:hypothetical protein